VEQRYPALLDVVGDLNRATYPGPEPACGCFRDHPRRLKQVRSATSEVAPFHRCRERRHSRQRGLL